LRDAKQLLQEAYQKEGYSFVPQFSNQNLDDFLQLWIKENTQNKKLKKFDSQKSPSEYLLDHAWSAFFEAVYRFDPDKDSDLWPKAEKQIQQRFSELDILARYQNSKSRTERQLAITNLMDTYRGSVRKICKPFSPNDSLYQQANMLFFEAAKKFDPTNKGKMPGGKPFWAYAYWQIRGPLIKQASNSDDARKIYKDVWATWEQLAQELGWWPTRIEVENEMVASPPRKWSEKRLRKAVSEVLESNQVPFHIDDTTGANPPILLSRVILHQLYDEAKVALKKEANAQKFLVLLVLYGSGEYQWLEIIDRLTEPPNKMFSVWGVVCNNFALISMIPCNFLAIFHYFEEPPPTLKDNTVSRWYNRAWRQIRGHHIHSCASFS
jgi:DNA-directed RNA polymerase specialized sigma subunit